MIFVQGDCHDGLLSLSPATFNEIGMQRIWHRR